MLRGHLLDLVQRAERIVVVEITSAERRPIGDSRLSGLVVANLHGPPRPRTLRLLSAAHLASGRRYVLFLRRQGEEIESLAPAGVVFQAPADDQRFYRHSLKRLSVALQRAEPNRTDDARAALIGALSAAPHALRYHAALNLSVLTDAGHGPTASERRRLKRLLQSSSDPALAGLLASILRRSQTSGTAAAH